MIVGLLWHFQMAGYMGQLGLACSRIPRREIEPQLLSSLHLSLTPLAWGEWGRVSLGRETRVSHLVNVCNPGGNVEVLVRDKYNPYTLWEPLTIFWLMKM